MNIAEKVRLVLITDDTGRNVADLLRVAEGAIRGGATAIQIREKSADAATIQTLTRELDALCGQTGAQLFLNASLLDRLAALPPTVGLHFGRSTWHLRESEIVTKSAMPRLIGYSAHEIDEASRVAAEGAHFVTLSPIFETPSKHGILAPRGLAWLKAARQKLGDLPIVALGGVDPANARDIIAAGADGIAVIRALVNELDPFRAAQWLRHEVDLGLADRGII